MRQLGFNAASQELSLAFSKVGFQSAKVDDLSQRERSEVLRPEEIHLPLAGIILIGDRAEGTALVGADVGREREVRKCFADTEHKITSSFGALRFQSLRKRFGKAVPQTVLSHFDTLRKESQRIGLIHFSGSVDTPRACEAPALMAHRGQLDILLESCVPDVLVVGNLDGMLAARREQHYVEEASWVVVLVHQDDLRKKLARLITGQRLYIVMDRAFSFRCRRKRSCCTEHDPARRGGSARWGPTCRRARGPAAR